MCLKKIIVQASTKRQKHQISMKNVMFMSAKTVLSNILPVVNQKRYKLYEIFVSTVVEIRENFLTRRKFTNVLKLVLSCVCVFVFILFYLLVSSGCTTSVTYVRSSDQRSFVVSIGWVLSAKSLHLYFRIYHISPPKM